MNEGSFWRSGWVIAAAAAIAFVIKLTLALKTFGTNDVYAYQQFAIWSKFLGVELYRYDPYFNHPPSMIHVLQGMLWLSRTTAISFSFWLRLPAIGADAANLWLVWKLLGDRVRKRSIHWALVLLALAPALIMISGFHGNTDSVVLFFVLLSVYLIQKDASPWVSGAAMGLAYCVKIFPLIAAPAILLSLISWKRRSQFCAAAAVVLLVAWAPYLYQDPAGVARQVFGYRSAYGMWGLSYLLDQATVAMPGLTPVNDAFQHIGAYLALALVCLASWRISRLSPRPALFTQTGIAFFLFLAVASGFGVQYLAWLMPWAVEEGWLAAAFLYSASGVFLFQTYNLWAEGLPWYLADSNNIGTLVGYHDYALMICWGSVLCVLWLAWRRVDPANRISAPAGWALAATALLALIIVPHQLPTPRPDGYKYEDTVRWINARDDLELAAVLADNRRYADSMQAARQAMLLSGDALLEAESIIASDQAALESGKP